MDTQVAMAADPGAVQSGIWAASSLGRPPLSWVVGALFSPPWDAAATSLHAAACADPVPSGSVCTSHKKRLSTPPLSVRTIRSHIRGL